MSAFAVQSSEDYASNEIARIVEAMHRYIILKLMKNRTVVDSMVPIRTVVDSTKHSENNENNTKLMNTIIFESKYNYLTHQLLCNTQQLQKISKFNRIASVRDPIKVLCKMLIAGDQYAYNLFTRRYVLEVTINKIRVEHSANVKYEDLDTL